jgi:hypothetical protein
VQGQQEEWGADRAFCADLEGEGGGHLGERVGSGFGGESSHFLEHWSCGGEVGVG